MWKFMDGVWPIIGVLALQSCIDRAILSHQRAELTGPYKGCVCAPKEQK
jgi:hypothetical protein